jgi:uncharacterized protein (TIGR02677 family)
VTTETQPQPFAYLSAPNALLYGRVLSVFARARDRFTVHLRPEDVHGDLRRDAAEDGTTVTVEAVSAALEKLAEWGNLRADADTGRVTTVEDFNRARHIYQLTRHGQAAIQAIALYEDALGRRGQLQSVALADIAEQLASLLALAEASAEPDPTKAHLLLLALNDRFTSLADNAQAFMASLRRAIDFQDGDEEGFIAYKDQLISYIERFIADLANRGAQIADLIDRLEAAGVSRLLLAAAGREAADALPDLDGAELDRAAAKATQAALTVWENKWRGLRDWFVSQGRGRDSQAKLLLRAARSAITNLINAVRLLADRRGGRSDRSADYRALARFFAEAPDDAAAHRLWRAVFALNPARHLTVDARTEAEWEQAELPPGTAWAQATPLRISPRLRETGSYERKGAPNRVADRSAARSLLGAESRHEAEQTAAARRRLATHGPVLLSRLAGPDGLDPRAFRLFLAVLGDALAARGPGEASATATTGDGTMEVRLTLVDADRIVEIATEDGVLRGPEHLIEIIDLSDDSRPSLVARDDAEAASIVYAGVGV